jgi:hypothetical protein
VECSMLKSTILFWFVALSTLKTEAIRSSETVITICKTKWRHNSGHQNRKPRLLLVSLSLYRQILR